MFRVFSKVSVCNTQQKHTHAHTHTHTHTHTHVFMYSTVIHARFLTKLNFLDRFLKKFSNIKFTKFREPSCSMRTDGRTDMTKLTVVFASLKQALEKLPVAQPVNVLRNQKIHRRDQKVRHRTLPSASSVQTTLFHNTS